MKLLTFFVFIFSTLLGCSENANAPAPILSTKKTNVSFVDTLPSPVSIAVHSAHYEFPYQLIEPKQSFKMPDKLEEISGLCTSPDNNSLYAVQDEKGNIYQIDIASGEVTQKFDFGRDGDYEGLAIYQNTIFVTKSNGTIYEVKNLGKDHQEVIKHKTDLKGKNDVEGLCYQASSNSLLIACKGIPTMGETSEEAANRKFVYRFDLETKKLMLDPFYRITLEKVQAFLKEVDYHANFQNFQSFLNHNDSFKFNPSGIAIHPKTKEIYILSSSKKMLLILNEAGKIQYLAKLNKKIHRQPEGIAFGQDGTLFIANEGKGGHGKIYVYPPKTD